MWVDQEFHLDWQYLSELKERQAPWGGGLLSKATFYRTYSRRKETGGNEHFADVVQRNIEGMMEIRKSWYKLIGRRWDEKEMQAKGQQFADLMFDMKFLPPGRGLYIMGTRHVRERGNAALNNCAFVNTDDNRVSLAAAWLMDHLMLGVGVGFRVPKDGIQGNLLQRPSGYTWVYQVPDSREGWAEATRLLIDSYEAETFTTWAPKQTVLFDYSLVRPAGSPIKTFGGISSGPAPLIKLHEQIRVIMDTLTEPHPEDSDTPGEQFENWTTEAITDIMNLVGVCVIAGNVRRSAEIAIGSPADDQFIHMKDVGYEDKDDEGNKLWVPGPYAHRAGHSYMSNNSVWLDTDADFERIPDLVQHITGNMGRGEPGFINGRNIRKRGRLLDKVGNGNPWLREDLAIGMNPCGEIPLYSHELCNLIETFPTRVQDKNEWDRVLEAATFYASTVALLPSHDPDTNAVVAQNRRIGVSVSGVADWVDSVPFSRIHRWLDDGYQTVRFHNRQLAQEAGVPESIRVTAVKPSGTVSLLPWVSPGVHHPVQRRFIRRITFSQDDPVADRLITAGVPYEPLLTDPNGSYSFQFPMMSAGKGRTRSVEQVSVWEQASLAAFLQRVWADNAVSFTGTVTPREISQLEAVVTQMLPVSKALSFLVQEPDAPVYPQSPYEGITVEEFNKRFAAIDHDVDWSDYGGTDGLDTRFCDGDACEIDFTRAQ
jgi:ribonucleoside-triphosphate reductase